MLCVALKRHIVASHYSHLWSASIGLGDGHETYASSYLYENNWSDELDYVCQYHSK